MAPVAGSTNWWPTQPGKVPSGSQLGNSQGLTPFTIGVAVVIACGAKATAEEIAYWKDLDRLTTEAERVDNQVIYGDVNQGEGHEVHIAHVATARKLLQWARDLGVVA